VPSRSAKRGWQMRRERLDSLRMDGWTVRAFCWERLLMADGVWGRVHRDLPGRSGTR